MISKWKQDGLPAPGSEDWQQYLWKVLNPQGKSLHKDKVDVVNRIMEQLQQPEFQDLLKKRIPVLSFFGVEVYTPFYLQLYQQLSTIIQLNFYMLNPAPYCYWIEDKSEKQIARLTKRARVKEDLLHLSEGNRLLSSWGGLFRETYTMLFNRDEFVNSYDESHSIEPASPTSMLQKIQYDVFHNNLDSERVPMVPEDARDGSVVINACYTQVREVEVLYNYLVTLVDKKKESLSPRDIVVMVSDIDEYAPYIRAVFDHAPYKFPYTIADESITMGNNLFAAIDTLLALDTSKFTRIAIG
jgi:exodeoxyribonuclease V gamma subunit